jgi:hypothetical protein
MNQPNTLTLCNYLRSRQAYCEVMPPESFGELAKQAMAERAKAPPPRPKKQPQKRKQKQVAQPASAQ